MKLSEDTRNLSSGTDVGFYSATCTAYITALTFIIAILTPPLAGPWCKSGCIEYPYDNIISRFPRDYYWMYPAMILCIAFVVLIVSIHQHASLDKKVYSLSALVFATISSAILFVDYFLQLSVIQPSLLKRETDGIALLTQYNPHGIFIALEEVGYLMMSLSFFFIVPVFSKATNLEKTLRITLFVSFLLTIVALVLISLQYGIQREYRFEIAVITINYITLFVSAIMLSRLFKRRKVDI